MYMTHACNITESSQIHLKIVVPRHWFSRNLEMATNTEYCDDGIVIQARKAAT